MGRHLLGSRLLSPPAQGSACLLRSPVTGPVFSVCLRLGWAVTAVCCFTCLGSTSLPPFKVGFKACLLIASCCLFTCSSACLLSGLGSNCCRLFNFSPPLNCHTHLGSVCLRLSATLGFAVAACLTVSVAVTPSAWLHTGLGCCLLSVCWACQFAWASVCLPPICLCSLFGLLPPPPPFTPGWLSPAVAGCLAGLNFGLACCLLFMVVYWLFNYLFCSSPVSTCCCLFPLSCLFVRLVCLFVCLFVVCPFAFCLFKRINCCFLFVLFHLFVSPINCLSGLLGHGPSKVWVRSTPIAKVCQSGSVWAAACLGSLPPGLLGSMGWAQGHNTCLRSIRFTIPRLTTGLLFCSTTKVWAGSGLLFRLLTNSSGLSTTTSLLSVCQSGFVWVWVCSLGCLGLGSGCLPVWLPGLAVWAVWAGLSTFSLGCLGLGFSLSGLGCLGLGSSTILSTPSVWVHCLSLAGLSVQ